MLSVGHDSVLCSVAAKKGGTFTVHQKSGKLQNIDHIYPDPIKEMAVDADCHAP